jgi:hypothetical protein
VTRDEAIATATATRDRFGIGIDFQPQGAERRIIEIVPGAPVDERPAEAGPVRDALAWIVTFTHDLMYVEIAIDDANGEAVRLVRSR